VTLPTFLVIGAAKAGTTSIHRWLDQHPDVFVTRVKETNFFAFEGSRPHFRTYEPAETSINNRSILTLEEYERAYTAASRESARGEVAPLYLYWPGTAENIRRHVPDARLVVVFRNPVETAFSAYLHLRRDAQEPLPTFEAALDAEATRIRENWAPIYRYVDLGRYATQLERYLAVFPRSQIKVFLYEELANDPTGVVQDLFEFIGVTGSFRPETDLRYNVSGEPRSRLASWVANTPALKQFIKPFMPRRFRQALKTRVNEWNLRRPELSAATRDRLLQQLAPEIRRLEQLIGKDLSAWLQ
jgi:hypothetical protein